MERGARLAQLLKTASQIVRSSGVDALTLGRLATEAGVTKPVVYSHFPDRNALLLALYAEYDRSQTRRMEAVLEAAPTTLDAVSTAISTTYIDCVLGQGVEIPGVSAALFGTPELAKVKQSYDAAWQVRCGTLLSPFTQTPLPTIALLSLQGAADSLSGAAAHGLVSRDDAVDELARVIAQTATR